MKNAFDGTLRIANGIAISANVVGTLVVLALVGLVNYDVIARGFFNSPFLGAVELVQFSLVLIVFLQLPDVVRVNRLAASDGFQIVIGKRFPGFTRNLRRAIDLLSAVFMGLIAIAIFPEFVKMWVSQDYFGIPGVFTAPWWPVKLVILLSTALCTVLYVFKIVKPADRITMIKLLPETEDDPR